MNFAADMLEILQKLVGVGQNCKNIFGLQKTPLADSSPGL